MKRTALFAALFCGLMGLASGQNPPPFSGYYIDGYPAAKAKKINALTAQENSVEKKVSGDAEKFAIVGSRWQTGSVILVAFPDGNTALSRKIAETAIRWQTQTKANFIFDFGYDPVTKKYRQWSPKNKGYAAHIRITYEDDRCWSAIGTDSVNQKKFAPNEASMGFGNFDGHLPQDWESIVLHEFGHALGFVHEHQHELCTKSIRWEEGPNGEPSVYDIFDSWQGWSREETKKNLETFVGGKGSLISKHDPLSIMQYALPPDIFIDGDKSPCAVGENFVLSSKDIKGVEMAYPRMKEAKQSLAFKIAAAEKYLNSEKMDAPEKRDILKPKLDALNALARPLLYVQIASENQRALAQRIQRAAIDGGYFTPGIQNVAGKGFIPDMVEVRYLRYPQDKDYAERIVKMLKEQFGIKNCRPSYTEYKNPGDKPMQIEIWFPRKIIFE